MADKEVRQTVREVIIEMLEEQIQRQEAKLNELGEAVNKSLFRYEQAKENLGLLKENNVPETDPDYMAIAQRAERIRQELATNYQEHKRLEEKLKENREELKMFKAKAEAEEKSA